MKEHILAPLDGSTLAECVLPHVVALAKALDARITVLQALQSGRSRSVDPLGWQMRKAEAESYLDEVATRLQEVDLEAEPVVVEGKAAEEILNFAHDQQVGLIVLSSHGRSGLSRWNINSVVQKVIVRTLVPALIVRAYQVESRDLETLDYQKLLIPLDGSQRAECVLPLARRIVQYHHCQLLLAHAVNIPEVPRRTPPSEREVSLVEELTQLNYENGRHYLEEVQSRLSTETLIRLRKGENAAAELHKLVDEEDVDMVVLSAHGYSGEYQWPYGSVALNFIVYGTKPLLIVQDISEEEREPTAAERAAREQKGH